MKISTLLTLSPLLMPASMLAGTVLYTDSHHPPTNIDASVSVIYLDGPEQPQKQLFGELSSNPMRPSANLAANDDPVTDNRLQHWQNLFMHYDGVGKPDPSPQRAV